MRVRHRLIAYGELLRHYRIVLKYYWKERKNLGGGLFNEQESEFLPAALSLQEKPASPTALITGRLLMGLVVIVLFWSLFGKVDIIVNSSGKIVPTGYTKTIASVDVASVRALYVEDGQTVKAGQALIDLDSSASDSEQAKAVGDVGENQLKKAREQALITAVDNLSSPQLPKISGVSEKRWQAEKQYLEGQYRQFQANLQRLNGEIKRYSGELPIVAQRAKDYQDLAKNHDVAYHAYLEKEQARIDLFGQLADAQAQRKILINQTRKEAYDALTEAGKQADASQQDAVRAGEHSKLLRLTAPVNGTVQQLVVHTIGGVVPAAQALMLIVPQGRSVEVEAFIENKDVGFVQEGQLANVKVDAFDYTKYGTMPAHITHVSRDAIQDEKKGLIYSVIFTLDKSNILVNGKSLPLSAGMSVKVDIRTGTRRVIEFVLSPLVQQVQESLHER
jgi:hemolysin D